MGTPWIGRLHGIVPFYKEPGVNSHTVFKWVKFHMAGEYGSKSRSIPIKMARRLEPFASGVITIGIGIPSKYLRYLPFCDVDYTVKLKLGYTTVTDYFKDKVIDEKPFDHVNLDLVKEAAQSFVGTYIQEFPRVIFPSQLRYSSGSKLPEFDDSEDGDDENEEALDNKEAVKWGWNQDRHYTIRPTTLHREVTCHGIEICNFAPPEFCMKIRSSSNFSVRKLVRDLSGKLNTAGTIVEMEKTREGPYSKSDCIDRTDLYMKYFIPALDKHTKLFIEHVEEHLDKIPLEEERRLVGVWLD